MYGGRIWWRISVNLALLGGGGYRAGIPGDLRSLILLRGVLVLPGIEEEVPAGASSPQGNPFSDHSASTNKSCNI